MYIVIQRFLELRFITPFYEYTIHYLLHKINNKIHKKHHIEFHQKKVELEIYPIFFILFFYYIENYHLMLGTTQYYVIHSLSHFKPNFLPNSLKYHHELHHLNNSYNFCVSSKIPDLIFGTIF
jgi:hypothetical protein